jgi:NAD(P)-dependent dehydrogenase (short-subunit alcohol dehydrogenase family)
VQIVDVGDSKVVTAWINKIVSDHGKLDGAANLAGMVRVQRELKDETDEAWAKTMHINADGVFYCLRAELNVMREGGSIVGSCCSLLQKSQHTKIACVGQCR